MPIAANYGFSDLGGGNAFFVQLIGKDDLLAADHSTRAVRVLVAIEQPLVAVAFVAVAVTGLLRENARNAVGDFVDADLARVFEHRGRKNFGEGHGVANALIEVWNLLRRRLCGDGLDVAAGCEEAERHEPESVAHYFIIAPTTICKVRPVASPTV